MDKFEDIGRKRIGIAKRSVFELSTLYLKLSVDSSIYPFKDPCNCLCRFMSLFIHSLVSFRSEAVLVTFKNGPMENGDWSTVLIYKL